MTDEKIQNYSHWVVYCYTTLFNWNIIDVHYFISNQTILFFPCSAAVNSIFGRWLKLYWVLSSVGGEHTVHLHGQAMNIFEGRNLGENKRRERDYLHPLLLRRPEHLATHHHRILLEIAAGRVVALLRREGARGPREWARDGAPG